MLTTRVVLDSDAVASAAKAVVQDETGQNTRTPQPSDVHLRRAGELLAEMRDPGIATERFHDLDARFHRELCAVAGNPVTDIILASLSSSILDYVCAAAAATDDRS
ncbi:FCD domain-containing protein [Brevibacterium aurantiacum]|uniref:FCD domain-containing protein n=1 Tax=Brevibacterium aurantiacum TaxID=273384 RepID=UPI001643541D|nr:FCD domain-containing protein [Brevibacterium aurantiacum]